MSLINKEDLRMEMAKTFGHVLETTTLSSMQMVPIYEQIMNCIDNSRIVEVEPVKPNAKWIRNIIDGAYVCSNCEGAGECCTNYCPNCGAKMDKEADNEIYSF